MKLQNVSCSDFFKIVETKKIICVGAGQLFKDMLLLWKELIINKIIAVADNYKQNTILDLGNRKITVNSVEELSKLIKEEYSCILITSMYCKTLYQQLYKLYGEENIDCFIYPVMSLKVNDYEWIVDKTQMKIPKKIHYFWFGKGDIPKENQLCIESWEKYCPDYEIIKWTEDNYDISKCNYMKQAYEMQKWGFVPDYARLDVLYEYGGIYLDTDVELIKNIDDLLYEKAFVGFQRNYWIGLGLGCGCMKHMDIFKDMRDYYNSISFIEDGKLNLVASPFYQTMYLKKHGLINNNEYQVINGVSVFPTDFFDPLGYAHGILKKTKHTYSIHHYGESWTDLTVRRENNKKYMEINSFLT